MEHAQCGWYADISCVSLVPSPLRLPYRGLLARSTIQRGRFGWSWVFLPAEPATFLLD